MVLFKFAPCPVSRNEFYRNKKLTTKEGVLSKMNRTKLDKYISSTPMVWLRYFKKHN